MLLTHWGRVTHICVSKLTIIGSDNGLSPGHRQAIIWTNAGILLIGPLGTNFSEFLVGIQTFSFRKIHLKILSALWRSYHLGLNESIGPLGTNFNEILIEIDTFSFKKIHLKTLSGKCRPFCFGLNVLRQLPQDWWQTAETCFQSVDTRVYTCDFSVLLHLLF